MSKVNRRRWQPTIKVYCKQCKEWMDESKVKFENIEEDIQGKDILYFECPVCKTQQKSHRVG